MEDAAIVPGRIDEKFDAAALNRRLAETADAGATHRLLVDALAALREDVRTVFFAALPDPSAGRLAASVMTRHTHALVQAIFDHAAQRLYPAANPTAGERVALVALAGTARGDMAPYSDIDLMFLTAWKLTPRVEQIVEATLYALWDLDLKIGHAVRSVDEAIRLARSDMEIRTTLLETRLIGGDEGLYGDLRQRFERDLLGGSSSAFINAKLAERDARHNRLGDSRYVLEPNVKDGKGGLRDLHALYWIAKHLYRVDNVGELAGTVFEAEEIERFTAAEDFLLTVRCGLHLLAGRAEERLSFDVQVRLAGLFGHADADRNRAVEAFMRRYFATAKDVGDLTRILAATLEAENQTSSPFSLLTEWLPRPDIGGFRIERGRVTLAEPTRFQNNPVDLIALFHIAQSRSLDIHPNALRAASRSVPAIDDDLRNDPEANRLFLEILCSRKDPETALRRMSEAGVLGRFLPEFGRVIAQMQFDMYHVYTTDEHTLRAIGLLHQLERGALAEQLPLASKVVKRIVSRRALYVALLLHDIAKGAGTDHSAEGEQIALGLCRRFGMSDEEAETAAWLVRWHLLLTHIAFKRDLEDDLVIEKLAEHVQSPERLRLLLVLTTIDVNAVGPGRWTNWTATLLERLFNRVVERLDGDAVPAGADDRARAVREKVGAMLAAASRPAFERFAELPGNGYWLAYAAEDIRRHFEMVEAADPDRPNLSIRPDHHRNVTAITLYARDRQGLAARIAGALAAAGASIVQAKLTTFANGFALDTFIIENAEADGPDLQRRTASLNRAIAEALDAPEKLRARLDALTEKYRTRMGMFADHSRVLIENEVATLHTVVEVNCPDRPGLLHDLTSALAGLRLTISGAKIATFGERAVDVFYVKDQFGLKITDERRLAALREALEAAARPVARAA